MSKQFADGQKLFAESMDESGKHNSAIEARLKNLEDWKKNALNNSTHASPEPAVAMTSIPALPPGGLLVEADLKVVGPALSRERLNQALSKMAQAVNPIFYEYGIVGGTIKINSEAGRQLADDLNKSLKDGSI